MASRRRRRPRCLRFRSWSAFLQVARPGSCLGAKSGALMDGGIAGLRLRLGISRAP
jgi:hypothetical protein